MSFKGFLLVFTAAVCAAVSPVRAQVTTSVTRDYVFPPVGLGSSETASITVVNTAPAASGGTNTAAAAPSCTGTISFSNANGAIGTPASFTLGSEQFKTVTLAFANAGLTGIRGEIQGKVSLTVSTSTAAPCSPAFTLETYDSTTGATHAVIAQPPGNAAPRLPIVVPGIR